MDKFMRLEYKDKEGKSFSGKKLMGVGDSQFTALVETNLSHPGFTDYFFWISKPYFLGSILWFSKSGAGPLEYLYKRCVDIKCVGERFQHQWLSEIQYLNTQYLLTAI